MTNFVLFYVFRTLVVQAYAYTKYLGNLNINFRYYAGFMKTVPSEYTLLMNTMYLFHCTHVAEGIVFRKHTVEAERPLRGEVLATKEIFYIILFSPPLISFKRANSMEYLKNTSDIICFRKSHEFSG